MANLNSSIQVYDLDRDPHQAVLEAVAAAVGTEMADRTAISAASCSSSADRSAMTASMAISTGISQTAGTALTSMAARGAPIAMSTVPPQGSRSQPLCWRIRGLLRGQHLQR